MVSHLTSPCPRDSLPPPGSDTCPPGLGSLASSQGCWVAGSFRHGGHSAPGYCYLQQVIRSPAALNRAGGGFFSPGMYSTYGCWMDASISDVKDVMRQMISSVSSNILRGQMLQLELPLGMSGVTMATLCAVQCCVTSDPLPALQRQDSLYKAQSVSSHD